MATPLVAGGRPGRVVDNWHHSHRGRRENFVACCGEVGSSLTTITVITRSHFLSTVISVTGRYLGGHTRSRFRFLSTFKDLFRV